MSDETITTVIPTYRRPALLPRAITSVLNQTYRNVRVLVVDNASGDGTADVVREMAHRDDRVEYHCHPKNIGLAANFQSGLELVRTAYFSFLSDDDILLPDFYQVAIQSFRQYPEAYFVILGTVAASQNGTVLGGARHSWKPGLYLPPDGFDAMVGHSFPTWTSMVFRSDITRKIGYLNSTLGPAIDQDFEYRAAACCPYVVVPRPGAVFVIDTEKDDSRDLFPEEVFCEGRLKIIDALMCSQAIPSEVKQRAEAILRNRYRKKLYIHGFGHLLRCKHREAVAVADALLHEHHEKKRASVLRLAIYLHRVIGCRASQFLLMAMKRVWIIRRKFVRPNVERSVKDEIERYIETVSRLVA